MSHHRYPPHVSGRRGHRYAHSQQSGSEGSRYNLSRSSGSMESCPTPMAMARRLTIDNGARLPSIALLSRAYFQVLRAHSISSILSARALRLRKQQAANPAI
eukprot:scaffold179372_cov31-Tisochrysis_lutea.AAC.2